MTRDPRGGDHATPVPEAAAERVRALLAGALSPAEREAAVEHLRGCAGCVAVYDRIAEGERIVSGGESAVLGAAAAARILDRLERGAPAAGRARDGNPLPVRRWLPWPAVGAAAALVLLWQGVGETPIGAPNGGPAGREWQARGIPAASTTVGVRLFRLREEGGWLQALPLDGDGRPARIAPGTTIGASYSNLGEHGYVTWIAWPDGGRPSVVEELSGAIERGVVDAPFDGEVRVDERFGVGAVRLFALFTGTKPSTQEILVRAQTSESRPALFPGIDAGAQRVRLLEVEGTP